MSDPTGPNLPAAVPEHDWAQLAKSALAAHGKGMRKLNRRTLRTMLGQLSAGMPLDTVSRAHGFVPESIRAYKTERPGLWAVIEQARSAGEMASLNKIAESPQWQAQDRLLQYQRPETYAPKSLDGASGQGGGATINVTIHVPRPELAIAGGQLPVIEAQAVVVDGPETVASSAPET